MNHRRALALILLLFMLLGFTYAAVTPVFEASDELWHYPLIRHLADGNPLPAQVFDPAAAGPWKQEASQPPLYYYLGAALTFWIDTADMEQVRWLNPHVDNGVITADGNSNLVVHDPAANPWQGTLLAVRLIRFASVLMGAATVYLTYRIAREVAPERPELALGAAAVNAFTPMFLFISGAVNNDNLVIPLASLAVWMMMRLARPGRWSARPWLLLGVVIGLAALTKISGVGLLALAAGTAVVAGWNAPGRPGRRRGLAALGPAAGGRLALVLLPALIVAGWWYARNVALYGDWSGWNAFIAVLGRRAHPASLAQLWGERQGFMMAYWGLFGGVNVPMAAWVYHVLNGVAVAAVPGLAIYLWPVLRPLKPVAAPAGELVRRLFDLATRHFPLLLCVLWSAAVVVGLAQWATTTWSSQGRLVFTAISTLTTLLVVGLAGWLPRRPAAAGLALLSGFMLLVAAAAPWLWIRPAYQVAERRPPSDLRIATHAFGGLMQLEGYSLTPAAARPGETVVVTLVWRALAPMARDWSVFVHLNDTVVEAPLAQRDMYPGQGLLATRLLRPGQQVVDEYHLRLPPTAVAPAELELVVGLYDYYSGERLRLDEGGEAAGLGGLALEPSPGRLPNSLSVNFENELELVGYTLEPRRGRPGETLDLTLHWRAQRPLAADYTFFAQVVAPDSTRWAGDDPTPEPGTSRWQPGQVMTVNFELALAADTPAGVYPLIVGVYSRRADGRFDRLQTVTPEGRLTDDFASLTPVRVDGP